MDAGRFVAPVHGRRYLPPRIFRYRHLSAHALGQFRDHRGPHLCHHGELASRRLAHVHFHGADARSIGRRRADDDELRARIPRDARRTPRHRRADRHPARGLDRHCGRLGGVTRDTFDPDNDAAELFEGARLRRRRSSRDAWNSDPALDHARHHGRPALHLGRRSVHGRDYSRRDARHTLFRVRHRIGG